MNDGLYQQFCSDFRYHMFEQLFFKTISVLLKQAFFVDVVWRIRVMTPNLSVNRIFWSFDVLPVSTKISGIKVVKPLISWNHRVINLKIVPLLYYKGELHRNMMTPKVVYGIPNEIKELELDYMEHDCMRIKGHKRDHGTSRNLKLVVKSHMMLFDVVKIVKRNFMSIGLVHFHIHSIMLIHDQINNTEHYSWCIL